MLLWHDTESLIIEIGSPHYARDGVESKNKLRHKSAFTTQLQFYWYFLNVAAFTSTLRLHFFDTIFSIYRRPACRLLSDYIPLHKLGFILPPFYISSYLVDFILLPGPLIKFNGCTLSDHKHPCSFISSITLMTSSWVLLIPTSFSIWAFSGYYLAERLQLYTSVSNNHSKITISFSSFEDCTIIFICAADNHC